MGDTRYLAALEKFEAARRDGNLDLLSPATGIQALGALAAEADPVKANVLATRLLNQTRRSAILLASVADGVIALDDEGRIQFANPAAERLLGWDAGGLLGCDFHDTVGHRRADGVNVSRDDCPLLQAIGRGSAEAVTIEGDCFERHDGTTFLVGIVAAPIFERGVPHGTAVVFRDITAQKARERELALHAAALDAVPVAVLWIARDGQILYGNQAAAKHLGYDREELPSLSVFDISPLTAGRPWEPWWDEVRARGGVHVETEHLRRDGSRVPVAVQVKPVAYDGADFHVAVITPRADRS